jgi:excinuclease UvrABC nuclease subunit
MSKWQLYKNKKELPMMCGVYVMYKDAKVVYVGVSKEIRKRFSKHSVDQYEYVKVKPAISYGTATDLERKLIKRLQPELNSRHKTRSQLSGRHRVTLDSHIYKRLRVFCFEKDIKIKNMIEDLITQFLKAVEDSGK